MYNYSQAVNKFLKCKDAPIPWIEEQAFQFCALLVQNPKEILPLWFLLFLHWMTGFLQGTSLIDVTPYNKDHIMRFRENAIQRKSDKIQWQLGSYFFREGGHERLQQTGKEVNKTKWSFHHNRTCCWIFLVKFPKLALLYKFSKAMITRCYCSHRAKSLAETNTEEDLLADTHFHH